MEFLEHENAEYCFLTETWESLWSFWSFHSHHQMHLYIRFQEICSVVSERISEIAALSIEGYGVVKPCIIDLIPMQYCCS